MVQQYWQKSTSYEGKEMTDLRKAAEMALYALTCSDENDDIGHRCVHCDDYVDRNRSVRDALRAALEQEKKWDLIREMHNVEDKT